MGCVFLLFGLIVGDVFLEEGGVLNCVFAVLVDCGVLGSLMERIELRFFACSVGLVMESCCLLFFASKRGEGGDVQLCVCFLNSCVFLFWSWIRLG